MVTECSAKDCHNPATTGLESSIYGRDKKGKERKIETRIIALCKEHKELGEKQGLTLKVVFTAGDKVK